MITHFILMLRYHSLFILLIALLIGCESDNGEISSESMQPDMHNSMIALDWAGTYHGVVPCADCEGIDSKIILNEDLTYQFERIYLGRSDQVFRSEGTFSWSEDGSQIQLNHSNSNQTPAAYQVGENRLFQLDMDGNRIDGDLADHYVLSKVIDNLSGLQWELFELEGTILNAENETMQTPSLHFLSGDNRVSGNGGCNQFNGRYNIMSGNKIFFTGIVSTKMACDQMETESKFFESLERADRYTLNHDTLSLNQTDQMNLARFLLLDE